MLLKNPRLHWLFVFVFFNIVAALIILSSGKLLGDVGDLPLWSKNDLIWASISIIFSFVIILVPLFELLEKIQVNTLHSHNDEVIGRRVGKALLLFQLGFIAFFLSTGTFVAGSTVKSESLLSIFWVLVPNDALFLIYYGVYRKNKLFYPNLVVSIISNILRGWSAIFLIIIFMEWCRLVRAGKLRIKYVLICFIIVMLSYPFLLLVKLQIRFFFNSGFSIFEISNILQNVSENLSVSDFLSLVTEGLNQIVGRLQFVSNVITLMHFSNNVQHAIDLGNIAPFWREGLQGLVLDRLTGIKVMNIGVAMTEFIDPNQVQIGSWNMNTGYTGWFFVMPYYVPLYILYTCSLAFLSMALVKKISRSSLSRDMLWFGWLTFLIPGWLASFVLFIYALIFFLCLQVFLILIPKWIKFCTSVQKGSVTQERNLV